MRSARATWPYPALLPHSVKIYPVVQVAPELGPQSVHRWPPPMNPAVRRWREDHRDYPNTGNQIYLHVPFCPFLCHFCPLYKMKLAKSEEQQKKAAFVEALIGEIELYGASGRLDAVTFNAIYFGGGTPTELTTEQLGRILQALRDNFRIAEDAEITLEGVARQMIAGDYVERALEVGFNRFSWGVQSLNLRQRKRIGRGDQVDDYTQLLGRIRAASPTAAANCEIMAGLPEQSFEELKQDIDTLMSWQMNSLDILYYVPMPGTKLHSLVEMKRREAPLFGNRLLKIRDYTNHTLRAAGYRQATGEVFVRNERDLFVSTGFGGGGHGLNTHLALGPSGFGQVEGTVYQNVCDLEAWQAAIGARKFPIGRGRTLTRGAALRRAALLSIIQLELPDFVVEGARMHAALWRWRRHGLVRRSGAAWRLTEKGALWYNHMQMDVLTLLDMMDVAPMFGSSRSIHDKLAMDEPVENSEAYELQSFLRRYLPLSGVTNVPYRAAVRALGTLLQHDGTIGFTGPLAGGESGQGGRMGDVVRLLRQGSSLWDEYAFR